jgi:hypothetical protein
MAFGVIPLQPWSVVTYVVIAAGWHFLFRLPAVAHIRTNLVLKNIKLQTFMPV